MQELTVKSSIDGSDENSLMFYPSGQHNVPLLVGLHTWSFDRFNQIEEMLPRCQQRNWALLLPEFRGSNLQTNPRAKQACGSQLAMQDIIDALDFVCDNYPVSSENVFLLGGSGGGHMALMMAAYSPSRWRAISSWCPITDLAKWHKENSRYAPHIEACCGGAPSENPQTSEEYKKRSPITYIENVTDVNLSLHHGRFDKSVPYTHSFDFAVALEQYKPKRFFFEIFDGGHDIHYDRAFNWFESLLTGNTLSNVELTK